MEGTFRRGVVGFELGQFVVITHEFRSEVLLENSLDSADITLVSDTTTVVDLGDDDVQSLVGDLGLFLQAAELPTAGCSSGVRRLVGLALVLLACDATLVLLGKER